MIAFPLTPYCLQYSSSRYTVSPFPPYFILISLVLHPYFPCTLSSFPSYFIRTYPVLYPQFSRSLSSFPCTLLFPHFPVLFCFLISLYFIPISLYFLPIFPISFTPLIYPTQTRGNRDKNSRLPTS